MPVKNFEKPLRFLTSHPALAICLVLGVLHTLTVTIDYNARLHSLEREYLNNLRISSGAVNHALVYYDGRGVPQDILETTGILFVAVYDKDGKLLGRLGGIEDSGVAQTDAVQSASRGWGRTVVLPETDFAGLHGESRRSELFLVYMPVNRQGQPTIEREGASALLAAYDYYPIKENVYRDVAFFALPSGALLALVGLGLIFLVRRVRKVEAKARIAAEEAVWVKNQFLSNISHELRTPLNGIMGMVSLLRDTKLDKEQAELAMIAGRCADSLLELVENILLHIKFEIGKAKLEEAEFDLSMVLGLLSDVFSVKAKAKGLEFALDIDPRTPRFLYGDSEKLARVLTNLLDNAVKFTRAGKIVLHADLAFRRGDEVEISFLVSDTGIGIPEGRMERLFEPFVQGDGSATREFGGLGMGLCLTRELVNALGGDIRAKSELGVGSQFKVVAPFRLVEARAATPLIETGPELHPLENMLARVGGDRETALKLYRAFAAELAEKPFAMKRALETGDYSGSARLAGELKNLAGSMGASGVKMAAVEFEAAKVSGDASLMADKAERLMSEAAKVRILAESIATNE